MSDAVDKPSLIWFYREVPLFEHLSDSFYNSIDHQGQLVEFKRDEVLATSRSSGPVIHVVVEGQVKLRRVGPQDKEIILDVLGPSDVFGALDAVVGADASVLSDSAHPTEPTQAVGMGDGSTMIFTLEMFRDQVRRRPAVMINLTRLLGLRQRQLQLRLARLLFRTSLGKVAGLLAELGERFGETTPEGTRAITIQLSHRDIAGILGLKRETVSEAMAELALRELIDYRYRKVTLLRPVKDLDAIA